MKKTLKIAAVVMAVLMVTLALASCGKTLSGTYAAEVFGTGVSYEFSGKNVEISLTVAGATVASAEGTYKIDGDKITFEFDSDKDDVKKYSGEFAFEEGDDYIKIGTFGKFTKKD